LSSFSTFTFVHFEGWWEKVHVYGLYTCENDENYAWPLIKWGQQGKFVRKMIYRTHQMYNKLINVHHLCLKNWNFSCAYATIVPLCSVNLYIGCILSSLPMRMFKYYHYFLQVNDREIFLKVSPAVNFCVRTFMRIPGGTKLINFKLVDLHLCLYYI
jgi:hypothetical protein